MRRVTAFVLAAVVVTPAAPAAEVHQDFRQKQFNPQLVRMVGPNVAKYVQREPEGLRIVLPQGGGPKGPVGVAGLSFLRGDFTATVDYEVLAATPPPADKAVGVTAYVMLDGPTQDGIMLGRFHQADAPPFYRISHMVKGEGGKRQGKWFDRAPTTPETVAGTLRLGRVGPVLTLSAAARGSADFRTLASLTVGTDDVQLLRIAAEPDGADTPVDVRVTDLRIRADQLLSEGEARATRRTVAAGGSPSQPRPAADEPEPDQGTRPMTGSRKWVLWGALGGGIVLALVGVGVRAAKRRSGPPGAAHSDGASDG